MNNPQNLRYGYTQTGERIEPPEGWMIVPEGSIVGARYRVFWRDRLYWSIPTNIGPELQKNQRRAGVTDSILAVAIPDQPYMSVSTIDKQQARPYACRCHTPRPDTPRYTRAVSWMARAYFDDGQNITIDVIDKNDVRMIAEIFDISAHVVAYDVLREIVQVSRDADGHPRLPLKGGE